MLVINNLTKMYSGKPVNNSISFTVEKGEIFGLLGPNGSGKTTLISQIIGFLKPTKGYIKVSGIDVISAPDMARKLCSLQPQENISLNGLTPRQAIELTGRIRNGNKREIKEKTDELLKDLQLEEWADQQTEKLSGGIKRLVTFCMAVVVPGKLVILDEPTNDVDPIRRKLLWEQVRKVANGGATVLLITHNVLEAERSVDRLALINNGKLVEVGTPASLKGAFNKKLRLELTLYRKDEDLNYPSYVSVISHNKQKVILSLSKKHSKELMDWVFSLQESNKIEEFSLSPATLEDAYSSIIGSIGHQEMEGEQYVISYE